MQRNVGGGRQKAYKKCRCSPRQTRAAAAKGTKISRLKGDAAAASAATAAGRKLPGKLPLLAFIINMASN